MSAEATTPAGLPWRLYKRFQHIVHEFGKFGVVGAIAFVVDTVIYTWLLSMGWETITAKTIATVISATLAFVGNRFWTWRNRQRSGLTREYVLYFVFNAIGLGIAAGTLAISHYGLGSVWPVFRTVPADVIASQIAGTVFASVFRFWSYRRFVFVVPTQAPAEPEAGEAVTPQTPAAPVKVPTR